MNGDQKMDTTLTLKPLTQRANPQPFTKAFALTAEDGCCEKGHLAFFTDKTLFIEIDALEAQDAVTATRLLDALRTEAIDKQIMQVRWPLTEGQMKKWAKALEAQGYQMSEGGMARWKNPCFNRDIAMGI